MALINPHINFNGNAEEAFTFYKSVFGGEFAMIMRFKDMASPEFPVPDNEANKIMHIALPIGNNVLMANDVPESMGRTNENENRSKISISALMEILLLFSFSLVRPMLSGTSLAIKTLFPIGKAICIILFASLSGTGNSGLAISLKRMIIANSPPNTDL